MTCAPRAAAARTARSAFAILLSIFQSQENWIAATVTERTCARKCSGSKGDSLPQRLASVQQALLLLGCGEARKQGLIERLHVS
jgi:hypothetical protein